MSELRVDVLLCSFLWIYCIVFITSKVLNTWILMGALVELRICDMLFFSNEAVHDGEIFHMDIEGPVILIKHKYGEYIIS